MSKPIKKIILILIFITVLPAVFFTSLQMTSLNKDERIIADIYKNQLESILFSVNQYSEDLVSSWLKNIETILSRSKMESDLRNNFKTFLNQSSAIKEIFVADSLLSNQLTIKNVDRIPELYTQNEKLKGITVENLTLLNRLYKYFNSGFQKIEPLQSSGQNIQYLMFVLEGKKFCIVGIDKQTFVKQNLSSKIQSITRDQFSIVVYNSVSNSKIYENERTDISKIQQREKVWLIPEYKLGILLKGRTIEGLVNERLYTNLFSIAGLLLLMIVTSWYGYRNIKKEIELAQIKSDFVSNVSHELRTPLALISMFAETLEMNRVKSEEKRQEYYEIISHESNRLSRIVNSILSFSQIEAGKKKYNFSTVDLNEVTSKVFETYSYHLASKGFDFRFEPSNDLPKINGDAEAISEAVINLIDNAVKYSADNKFVVLRTKAESGFVVVEVEDNGIGISKSDQQKIFDKFYRASKGLVHNTKGTGLGLTLVKHIMEAHQGKTELHSEVGKGSLFRLLFPTKNM
ncbi:MAG: ATP-binding protein [Bacteroidota bacterium]